MIWWFIVYYLNRQLSFHLIFLTHEVIKLPFNFLFQWIFYLCVEVTCPRSSVVSFLSYFIIINCYFYFYNWFLHTHRHQNNLIKKSRRFGEDTSSSNYMLLKEAKNETVDCIVTWLQTSNNKFDVKSLIKALFLNHTFFYPLFFYFCCCCFVVRRPMWADQQNFF